MDILIGVLVFILVALLLVCSEVKDISANINKQRQDKINEKIDKLHE